MKFRTRLRITFLSIILVPLICTVLAFLIIGLFLTGSTHDNFSALWVKDTIREFTEVADNYYVDIRDQITKDVTVFDRSDYLEELSRRFAANSADLLVLKGKQVYFSQDPKEAEQLLARLPKLEYQPELEDTGFYFNKDKNYVRQVNFTFSDGADGCIYIITRNNHLISKTLLRDMILAILVILVFTAVSLTKWIQKGVFAPVYELNEAMKKIKEGNFDYLLPTREGGEIGDLYRNYEDMRLRLKESAEEKIQNENANREMISNISHDLKTPITAIKGYVEGIIDGVADTPEKLDKYVKTIYNKANDMDKLINELTLYSSVDNNRISYNFHRLNVSDYFGDCVEEVGLDLESKNIQLNFTNLVDGATMVIADPEQMKKVINNIISNSVKYMDKQQGVIDIRLLDEGESVRIEIEDNGKGIEQKNLAKIFERFYRTDASRNSAQGGSGIGLSIVKKIIEDHGGYIWATSKIGEGTCMHFVLRKYKELK